MIRDLIRPIHTWYRYVYTCFRCCDTLHDTHYISISPNYYKYVSFYYVTWYELCYFMFIRYVSINKIRFRYVLILFCNKTWPIHDFLSWYKLIRSCYALLQILDTDTKETRYGYVTTISSPPSRAAGFRLCPPEREPCISIILSIYLYIYPARHLDIDIIYTSI